MERLAELGEKMGLNGEDLRQFVLEQQAIERDERQREREFRRVEADKEEAERERRHMLEIKRLEMEAAEISKPVKAELPVYFERAKLPKLPPFQDGKDDLDSYLQRFERQTNGKRNDGPLY